MHESQQHGSCVHYFLPPASYPRIIVGKEPHFGCIMCALQNKLLLNLRPTEVRLYLVLIDQQSVGKRSLYLMDTVNAKKRWTTIYYHLLACQQIFERETHSDKP
jgi:hypothetical protein